MRLGQNKGSKMWCVDSKLVPPGCHTDDVTHPPTAGSKKHQHLGGRRAEAGLWLRLSAWPRPTPRDR